MELVVLEMKARVEKRSDVFWLGIDAMILQPLMIISNIDESIEHWRCKFKAIVRITRHEK